MESGYAGSVQSCFNYVIVKHDSSRTDKNETDAAAEPIASVFLF